MLSPVHFDEQLWTNSAKIGANAMLQVGVRFEYAPITCLALKYKLMPLRTEEAEIAKTARRAAALLNRTRNLMSMLPVNHKRCYRVMKAHRLLPPK